MDIFNDLHKKSIEAGLIEHTTFSEKTDYKKIEYKMQNKTMGKKKNDPIYIMQIKRGKQVLKCKLYNLHKYTHLFNEINEETLQKLLNSNKCKGIKNGCNVGIKFLFNNKSYLLCRHLIFFRNLTKDDIDSVWKLISAEITYR